MKRIADRIKNIPPEKRDRFMWITIGSVVVLMMAVWIIVGNGRRPKVERSLKDLVKEQYEQSRNNLREYKK